MKSVSSSHSTTKRNRNPHEPWLHRHFQKDKLRVEERYWRHVRDVRDASSLPESVTSSAFWNSVFVLPDGRTWRRYLPLLTHLVRLQQQEHRQRQPGSPGSQTNCGLHLVLLESASELMDWRNLSPCVPQKQRKECLVEPEPPLPILTRESAAPRERTKLLELLESEQRQAKQHIAPAVSCFCDLSVREEECDEWDFLGYTSMSIVERSRHALVRAGRILSASKAHSRQKQRENQPVILLAHDEEEKQALLEICGAVEEEDLLLLNVTEFLVYISKHNHLSLKREGNSRGGNKDVDEADTKAMLLELEGIRKRSDEDYERRNTILEDGSNNDSHQSGNQEYLTEDKVQKGLRSGEFVGGLLEVTKQNPKEAFVKVGSQHYFVNQRLDHFNRALDGDRVILHLLPEAHWGRPIGRRRLMQNSDNDEDGIANLEGSIPPVPSGRVVAIANRSSRNRYVATLVDAPMSDDKNILVVPFDVRIPKIRIATKVWNKFLHHRLLVTIDDWEVGSMYPRGHILSSIGPIGDLEVEIKCLLIDNQIDLDPFSAAALASLPSAGTKWVVPDDQITVRRDLRLSRRVFSVDPPGCQDIDDAFHAEVLENGDVEIGVHIADVTHFVKHNSALDLEAQKRGTTFYLVDRRFDMLPSLLSADLCSLHGNVDRLAVSVIWILSADFSVRSVWYGRTVIRNCQAMTYDQAHNILYDKPPDVPGKSVPPLTAGYPVNPKLISQLKKDLIILRDFGRKQKKSREEVGGAVDLSSGDGGGELKFTLDNGVPIEVEPKKELEIHNTVAELMIFANKYVGNRIYEWFKQSSLLRIHRSVEESRFGDLQHVLDVGGVALEGSSNKALANTLKKVDHTGAVKSLIKSLATRAMSEAQYVCTGEIPVGNLSHYGLGVDKYTHFTSPIRRYADVVVHKQLLASLELEKTSFDADIPRATEKLIELDRPALVMVPDSNVISIMAGEGVDNLAVAPVEDIAEDDFDPDDFLDTLIEGASELVLGAADDTVSGGGEKGEGDTSDKAQELLEEQARETNDARLRPYTGPEVSRIAEALNKQNRMAKRSSMECQQLFLSVYFRDHEEIAQAVVTDLRENGCIVYIPKFDISGPVYLRDLNGVLQMDPFLFDLTEDSGQPPTLGFTGTPCRRFPEGKCVLVEPPNESVGNSRLEVSVPESKKLFTLQTVDVVSVSLSCDNPWDVRSRVPPPRFQLVANKSRPPPGFRQQSSSAAKKISSKLLLDSAVKSRTGGLENPCSVAKRVVSTFDALRFFEVPPVLEGVPLRSRKTIDSNRQDQHRQETFKGRLNFHQFSNPDTKSATQEAAMAAASEAAAQRRANAVQTMDRRNEYDSARRIENNIMARAQRLAADKRNTRRGKGS